MTEPRIVRITPRQLDILRELLADGAEGREIAERLGVSYETVRSHMRHIYSAAGLDRREQLIVAYFRKQIAFQIKRRESK